MHLRPVPVPPELRERARQTLNRYCELVDGGKVPVEVFATDCVVDYGLRRGPIQGSEALHQFFSRNKQVLRRTSHHVSSVRVHWTGGDPMAVRVSAHVYAWHELTDGHTFDVYGRYDDTMVDDDGRLLIVDRRFRTYGSSDPRFSFARAERQDWSRSAS